MLSAASCHLPQVRELNERCQKLGLEAVYTTVQRHDDETEQQQTEEGGGLADGASSSAGVPTVGTQTNDRFEEVRCCGCCNCLSEQMSEHTCCELDTCRASLSAATHIELSVLSRYKGPAPAAGPPAWR
jgi:hypothetical protein